MRCSLSNWYEASLICATFYPFPEPTIPSSNPHKDPPLSHRLMFLTDSLGRRRWFLAAEFLPSTPAVSITAGRNQANVRWFSAVAHASHCQTMFVWRAPISPLDSLSNISKASSTLFDQQNGELDSWKLIRKREGVYGVADFTPWFSSSTGTAACFLERFAIEYTLLSVGDPQIRPPLCTNSDEWECLVIDILVFA